MNFEVHGSVTDKHGSHLFINSDVNGAEITVADAPRKRAVAMIWPRGYADLAEFTETLRSAFVAYQTTPGATWRSKQTFGSDAVIDVVMDADEGEGVHVVLADRSHRKTFVITDPDTEQAIHRCLRAAYAIVERIHQEG